MASSKFNPVGSICVVTGGANGIGRSLSQHLASLGAKRVVVVDLSLSAAQKVVSQDLPPGVGLAIGANCGVEMDIRRVITETEFHCDGPIDAFFCNAGIPANGGPEVPNDEWERIWQVNVMQSVYVSRHLFPKYVARGKGVMVITASSAGLLNLPGALAYSVTKHAAVGLAEGLHIAYASRGVHVACLCPMGVRTGMVPKINSGMAKDSDAIVGQDGILSPDDVAKETVSAVIAGKFMVLPHKRVKFYFSKKAEDYEQYLLGMRKVYEKFGATLSRAPNMSSARL